jgi:hypothetical protein
MARRYVKKPLRPSPDFDSRQGHFAGWVLLLLKFRGFDMRKKLQITLMKLGRYVWRAAIAIPTAGYCEELSARTFKPVSAKGAGAIQVTQARRP